MGLRDVREVVGGEIVRLGTEFSDSGTTMLQDSNAEYPFAGVINSIGRHLLVLGDVVLPKQDSPDHDSLPG